jgi:RNA polymerase sigma-70 factor (ECF subfamily)
MTDREIIALCRDASTLEQGFRCMVSLYTKKIYWHVRRMITDHDDANDVVQNCFIKAWKGLPNFREDSRLYTWLYRIATNEAISFLNDKQRRQSISLSSGPEEGHPAGSVYLQDDPWFDGEAAQRNLRAAIDSLPARQKQVFVMRYYEELSYEEMEEVLGTSTGALKASFHHAVKKIESFLKQALNH